MPGPFDQLPTDPEWLRRCDEFAQRAAKELGGMVCLVVIQPHPGKIFVGTEGVPETGPQAEAFKQLDNDPARMLAYFSWVVAVNDKAHRAGTTPS